VAVRRVRFGWEAATPCWQHELCLLWHPSMWLIHLSRVYLEKKTKTILRCSEFLEKRKKALAPGGKVEEILLCSLAWLNILYWLEIYKRISPSNLTMTWTTCLSNWDSLILLDLIA
jgi:hypothetical protein